MSDRADEEVRGERSRAARQQQLQRGEAATAMAPAALPSPQITPGQSWSSWADGVKLHAGDGAESEDNFKECAKNREAMRLCRDDMPIFGQCPAQDEFYLVMCSHCSQVVKPQAFQAHYERRHGSISKPTSAYSSTTYTISGLSSRSRSGGVGGNVTASGSMGASSSGSNSTPSAKEKMPHRKPHFPSKVTPDDLLTPAVKVEKIHLKMDYSASSSSSSSKLTHVPTSSSSSSASTVSSSPAKPGLNSPTVPKAQLLPPGHIPNGKGHLPSLDKKPDSSTNASSRRLYRRQSEREFNPDIHCGVLDIGARKPCTRSLTCKTHSLSQRRAVPGRRKRFDTLLTEHKNRTREKELQHRSEPSQQTPPLRDPQPPLSRLPQDPHHLPPHGNGTAADAPKPFTPAKPKPHNPGLPRSSHGGVSGIGDPAVTHDFTQHLHSTPTIDGVSRLSSDEGENEEREEGGDKLDCHYSGYHPRPAAYCTFGSRLFGRSCYSFDRRWDRVRCALAAMMDKHVNSLMWKKIPLAPENSSSSAVASSHRSSTNSLSSSSGFLSPSPPPPYSQSYDSKPMLSYGTTLNARAAPQRAGEQLVYGGSGGGNSSGGGSSRQVSSSSPQMPSAHSSSLPSTPSSSRPPKSRSGAKSFRVRDSSSSATLASSVANSSNNNSSSSNSGGSSSVSTSSSAGAKKRKNSSLLTPHSTYAAESSSSSSSSSSSFKKNCAVNSGTSGSSFHSSLTCPPSSTASSSSSSSSSHSTGANCPPGRANSLSLRQEAASRGPPPASPAEPIKRMSVVMNSSDSTLSLGPFVHQSSEHHGHTETRIDSKRRKSSPASSSLPNTGSAGGGGGSQAPNRPKMTKSPAINNIHSKHARPMPGTPGLPNNSLIHQPKARP